MSADTDAILRGHLNVIDRRMDQLQEAIRGRDWDATEYRYDQVLRAVEKLRRAAT